ncbi:hypothetical protein ETB93_08365 [Lactiplantibacillus plantarum]|uniref:hypothetical protein n=1 Tax=Lactiplantibacillus plantarum TaxID=1590 RepID=UPI000B3C2417|nr:hypothetical protein [Lactiplantibacillus plantarum]MCT3260258.1 hypothetical protein [Lactiplantibacillus plantarum]OUS98892.1 Serine-aspartate repeat-containing protein D [Lactiplantibacillus plantarum]QAB25425.1 hypothetical protein EPT58_01435 [Lactiplantibacillus plantarum]RXS61999.1 hypothetical protein ETB93_08365 [Lactiplantibacillus plantarum]
METGILKQIDLTTTTERYFFVQVQRLADYVWIRPVQNFKPLELTVRVSDLQVNKHQAVADRGNIKYEFNDDTGGLVTQLAGWVH